MNMVDIVNAIRAEGSSEYQEVIPVATQATINSIADPLLTYTVLQNEFLSSLIGKIALSVVHNKTAKNPLAMLKKGTVPLGSDIEEIFTEMAAGAQFDGTGSTLLTQHKPSVKTIYHRRNRQSTFPVTISPEQLATAFTSWGKLEEFTSSIINSLYSGDNYQEYILMKNLMADAIVDGKVSIALVTAITDAATARGLLKAVKNASAYFEFPGSNFNKYATIKGGGATPVKTWTPKADQILILRADIATEIDVEALAVMFNLEKGKMPPVVTVDNFGAAPTCYAMLCDRSFFQVYDTLERLAPFNNPQSLAITYYWHHFQTISFSYFANAIAFCIAAIAITADVTLTAIDGGTTTVPTFANAAAVQAYLLATYPFVDFNDGISVPIASWTDTDTYNAAAAASYTFTGVLGTLPYGATNAGNKIAKVEVIVAAP